MIDISIIMPVYNEEKYLREAIDSILCQTADNFEFIIIDDASTDNSLSIIQSYADKRIVLIRNEQNIGNYPSRNKGMEVAVGKYICVMDADDIAYPQRLEDDIRKEFLKVCNMDKDQLKSYIQTWKDVTLKYENRDYLFLDLCVGPFRD